MTCHVINFYKFVEIPDASALRAPLKEAAQKHHLKGTILLAPEGLNVALAGEKDALSAFVAEIGSMVPLSDVEPKWSEASTPPFRHLKVKVKRWIIRFAEAQDPSVDLIRKGARLNPAEVKSLLEEPSGNLVIVDTRNEYETEVGRFEGAVCLPIRHFTQFPEHFLATFADQKDKTFLFYCTGGVRCEKVVPWAVAHGFTKATQIDGGILKYFEDVGSFGYQDGCFVFDDRTEVGFELKETQR